MNLTAAKTFILEKLSSELDPKLSYHGIHHTLDVLKAAEEICLLEHISPEESRLVQTAAAFHDAGFLCDRLNHERYSCDLAQRHLPRFSYNQLQIAQICSMILATKIPQYPDNQLEKILCDADLDYLGREDFFAIAETLYRELKFFKQIGDRSEWNVIQIQFIENQSYFTETNRLRRGRYKQNNLELLKKMQQKGGF